MQCLLQEEFTRRVLLIDRAVGERTALYGHVAWEAVASSAMQHALDATTLQTWADHQQQQRMAMAMLISGEMEGRMGIAEECSAEMALAWQAGMRALEAQCRASQEQQQELSSEMEGLHLMYGEELQQLNALHEGQAEAERAMALLMAEEAAGRQAIVWEQWADRPAPLNLAALWPGMRAEVEHWRQEAAVAEVTSQAVEGALLEVVNALTQQEPAAEVSHGLMGVGGHVAIR
jgi:hypothetical protein